VIQRDQTRPTQACVFALHKELRLPVYGLVDCNPYGIQVLNCYQNGYENKYGVPIQWLGLHLLDSRVNKR
jgi:hypothetical protein